MNDLQRFEFKFIVTAQQRDDVLAEFNGALLPDVNGSSTGVYPIVTLYYDTPDRRCFWEAWRGLPSRRKLRVRIYGTSDGEIPPASFVEVKHKLDGLGVKRRVQTSLAHALEIGSGFGDPAHFTPAEALIVREVHHLVHREEFRPTCALRYRRHAFFLTTAHAAEPVRITFDDELSARFRDLDPAPDDRRGDFTLIAEDHFVMELKGAGAVPYPVARWLAKSGLSPRSFSKYCAASRLAGPPPA